MILKPSIAAGSKEFQSRQAGMKARVQELKRRLAKAASKGLEAKGGKLPVRKRIERLKDPGTEALELSPLAAYGIYEDQSPGAGIWTGVAQVCGRECVIAASSPMAKGGAYFPLTVKKHLRAQEIAMENHLPCIYLMDSGGAYLPLQSEVFPDRDHFGRIFYNQARLSAMGISQTAVVLGSCTAGGAYAPAMADENVIVKNQGAVFLGGPPLVEAATGEKVDSETLGGAETHCARSGLCDHMAETEEEALAKAREIISRLKPPRPLPPLHQAPEQPLYPPEELYGAIPGSLKTPFDMRDVLARILDGSRFEEFKPKYGPTLLAGWGHICGSLAGIVANNGILFSESALKGAHFIDLCDQREIPLIFFQNIMGFMVGREAEWKGIAKHGAKMVRAVSLARVPKITVIAGGSFGAGNYGLCGRAYQPRFLWTWPSARISVMGGEQAADVMWSLKKKRAKNPLDEQKAKGFILEKYERESSPYYATARLWDDGLIDPADTRKVLAMGLAAAARAPLPERQKSVCRM